MRIVLDITLKLSGINFFILKKFPSLLPDLHTSSFNIEARYDDYKKEFYSIYNREFTKIWIKNIEEIIQWLTQIL